MVGKARKSGSIKGKPIKRAAINRKLMRSPSKMIPKTGHTYIFEDIEGDKYTLNNSGDTRVTVTLIDVTDNAKVLKRRGVAKMMGNSSAIWLDSLEGHKGVYVSVSFRGQNCEIEKRKDSSGDVYYALATVYD